MRRYLVIGVATVAAIVLAVFLFRGSEVPADLRICRGAIESDIGTKLVTLYLGPGDAGHEGIVLGLDRDQKYWYADVKLSARKFNQSCHVAGHARRLTTSEFEAMRATSSFETVELIHQ